MKFQPGMICEAASLYGGELSIEILSRDDAQQTITYRYTSECSDDTTEKVAEIIRQTVWSSDGSRPIGEIESIEAWEYRAYPYGEPDHGYFFPEEIRGFRAGKLLSAEVLKR